MRSRRVLRAGVLLAWVACAADVARAAPPVDLPSTPPPAVLQRPVRVPIAVCATADQAPPEDLSAKALLDELKRLRVRLEELAQERAELQAAHAELAAEKERFEAERIDFEIQRAEMSGPIKPSATATGVEAARVAALVKQMRPEKAAELVARLELSLATEVVRGMSGKAAAAVLERLPPERAAGIASRLALKDPAVDSL